MNNILNKFKKNKKVCVIFGKRGYGKTEFLSKCKNVILTEEELNNYEKRLYELKDLTILSLNEIKFNPKNQEAYERLNKHSDEIKKIKKILKNAKKVADKNGK